MPVSLQSEHRIALSAATAALALALLAGHAAAGVSNDATLAVTVHRWSGTIGADARAVSLNARQRHPRLMAASALRFSGDARRARTAIARQRPSSADGRRAKALSLRAFSAYVLAGRRWAASGRARLRGQKAAAGTFARKGAMAARAGNRLLVAAGALLR